MSDAEVDVDLDAALTALRRRVEAAAAVRREADPASGDPFLGLHLTDRQFDALLARSTGDDGGGGFASGVSWSQRMAALAETAGLDEIDLSLLTVAMAPAIDPRFEWLFGYLNDDLTRKAATAGLALELCGLSRLDAADRSRISAGGLLAQHHLVRFGDEDRPLLSRSLHVPDDVIHHLLGGDPEPEPTGAALDSTLELPADAGLVYLRAAGGAGLAEAGAALLAVGPQPIEIDLRREVATDAQAARWLRQAILRRRPVVIGPVDNTSIAALASLLDSRCRVVATGHGPWDPSWSSRTPLVVEIDVARPGGCRQIWTDVLGPEVASHLPAIETFSLDAERTRRAAESASMMAAAEGSTVGEEHLRAGARSQNTARLESLARRIEPAVCWDDLVLPTTHIEQLREIVARARHRSTVLDDWQLGRSGRRGSGIAVLFAGASGTGKTMSAEVLANALGQDLYRIDLSTVVDKYIGETEKNLERIFSEAEHSNAVLFFDEADALFGKRSEVSDAHDRHANVEVAYLLQRMEDFSGLAILATNLRSNLDEAFTRRLTALLDFPMPDASARRLLWDQCLGPKIPRSADLDLDFWADGFELAGGAIRNIALAAAFRAASGAGRVGMDEIAAATRQEYLKMGRLVTDDEFGRWR